MKTILVTGACGFVGSNLAAELLKRGYVVKGIDNFSYGFLRNIEMLLKNDRFTFYEGDIRDKVLMSDVSKDVDGIAHLAAFKIPRYGNALATLMINSKGTENVLEVARDRKCKVVFASTSDIYGKNPSLPFSEESDSLLGPSHVKRWGYAVSKIFDEHLCFGYYQEYGLPISIVRYFGGYGPHQNLTWWGGPQSVFIDCAFKKKPIPIHGNGKQTRSFTYVSDIVEGTLKVLESEKSVGEVFNIGNDREISIIDLAQMIWKMLHVETKPEFEFVSYERFSGKYEDVSRRIPDIRKAKTLLGFSPKVELEEGLPKTIEWQKQFVKVL